MNRPRMFALATLMAMGFLTVFNAPASETQTASTRAELAVEVTYHRGARLEIPVFEPGTGEGGISPALRGLSSGPAATDATTVSSLRIKTRREGETVIVDLVLVFDSEKEVVAGAYRVSENESIRAEELRRFGVEPITLKVVRAKPPADPPPLAAPPEVECQLPALEVIGLESSRDSPRSYRLSLRNVSPKNITALNVYVPEGGVRTGQQAEAATGRPLIMAGGTYDLHVSVGSGGQRTPRGLAQAPLPPKIVVGTVMFEDGSYEGEAETAAAVEARRRGRQIQGARLLPLLDRVLEASDPGTRPAVQRLKEQIYPLEKEVDLAVVEEIMARYPSLAPESKDKLRSEVEWGLREAKRGLLAAIKDFEERGGRSLQGADWRVWLKLTKQSYESLTAAP